MFPILFSVFTSLERVVYKQNGQDFYLANQDTHTEGIKSGGGLGGPGLLFFFLKSLQSLF